MSFPRELFLAYIVVITAFPMVLRDISFGNALLMSVGSLIAMIGFVVVLAFLANLKDRIRDFLKHP